MNNTLIISASTANRMVITAANGQRWDDVAEELVTHVDGDWADYLITPTQIGTSQDWLYTIPATLPAGEYTVAVYAGAAPVVDAAPVGSGSFVWSGTALVVFSNADRAKLALITVSSTINVSGLVAAGDPLTIWKGESRSLSGGNALILEVPPATLDLTGLAARFGMRKRVSGVGTDNPLADGVIEDAGLATQRIVVELTKAETAALALNNEPVREIGSATGRAYVYEFAVNDSAGADVICVTLAEGEVSVKERAADCE